MRFEVIDWENYSTIGVGRPQELITQQTLEKYRDSLALVVGVMAQRFGTPTGEAESGTEEEFNWALESHLDGGWPEIKWFFRKVEQFVAPADPKEITKALKQWKKVNTFREGLQKSDPPIYYAEYPGPSGFREALEHDLNLWLCDGDRPWVPDFAVPASKPAAETTEPAVTVPAEFEVGSYRQALVDRFGANLAGRNDPRAARRAGYLGRSSRTPSHRTASAILEVAGRSHARNRGRAGCLRRQ